MNPEYLDIVSEIEQFFMKRSTELSNSGIRQLIIDPGFVFGKNLSHNYTLLKYLPRFKKLGYPLLVGVSRKSMVNRLLNIKAEDALHASGALHTLALLGGADILRVHDVKEALEVIKVVKAYQTGAV